MVGAWEHLPAARVPAPLAPHVVAMHGYAADGLVPGVHRGLPSAGLTLVRCGSVSACQQWLHHLQLAVVVRSRHLEPF